MSFLTGLPGIEERLGEGLSGIAVNYRHSPIVEEYGSELAGPAAGDRAPDALLVCPPGRGTAALRSLYGASPLPAALGRCTTITCVAAAMLAARSQGAPHCSFRGRGRGIDRSRWRSRGGIWLGAGSLSDPSRRLCRLSLRRGRAASAAACVSRRGFRARG